MSRPFFDQLIIRLKEKPPGYKEAVEKLIAKRGVRGLLCELGVPPLTAYVEYPRKLWRMRQTNPALVCAELFDPVITDDIITFNVALYGPCQDRYNHDVTRGKSYELAARMLKDSKGRVTEICNFDLQPEQPQPDHILVKQ